jgi:tRNA(fMet)-specific endonuclease VapC
MTGKLLLDTNIVIALFAQDVSILQQLETADEIFIPAIVLGELYFGANKSKRATANLTRLDEFALSNIILGCDVETAKIYGSIKNKLLETGHPIPENDIWIAAVAIQHHVTLVTRDIHFNFIENLNKVRW